MGTTSRPETVDEVLAAFGEAGQRLNEIGAVAAGAGNFSAALAWPVDLGAGFDASRPLDLPVAVPTLAGYSVLVTGSGCRLRELAGDPGANLGAVVIGADGRTGVLHYRQAGNFGRPTVEFNSHLVGHEAQVIERGVPASFIIHAQPRHLTLLSHIPAYQSTERLNAALMRWEAETLVALPEGIGYLPFLVPGSAELMAANRASLRRHQLVLWAKHGVMARSSVSPLKACDLIEYAEAAAHLEYLNLTIGAPGEGLSRAELGRVVATYDVPTTLLDD